MVCYDILIIAKVNYLLSKMMVRIGFIRKYQAISQLIKFILLACLVLAIISSCFLVFRTNNKSLTSKIELQNDDSNILGSQDSDLVDLDQQIQDGALENKNKLERDLSLEDTKDLTIKYGGWVPSWAYDAGKVSIKNNLANIRTVSPIYYKISSTGALEFVNNSRSDLGQFIKDELSRQNLNDNEYDVDIIPTLQSFNSSHLSSLVSSRSKMEFFVESLIIDLIQNNAVGLDLNVESISLVDKDNFFIFLEYLSGELKASGLKLTMPVLPKWGDENTVYEVKPETRAVMDYEKLALFVDEIRIMAYDYSFNSFSPIAPYFWVEDILEYALERVPPEKISLGLNLYGYSWAESGGDMRALNYTEVQNIVTIGEVIEQNYNLDYREGWIKYNRGGQTRIAFYATPESVSERINLAKEKNISKIMFWRFGDDMLSQMDF